MNTFSSICDDLNMAVNLSTKMDLPTRREAVLHFFETIQKFYPQMTDFDRHEDGDFTLEEDRESGSYRWVRLESRRVCSGFLNPPTLEEGDVQNERVLEISPYHLDLQAMDFEYLDVVFTFDFTYSGNHDEVVAEALTAGTPFEGLTSLPGARTLSFEPTVLMALDESCRLQSRLSIETRTTPYQVRTGQFSESPISVHFAIRQFWGKQPFKTIVESYRNQRRIAFELIESHVRPQILEPLARTIAIK